MFCVNNNNNNYDDEMVDIDNDYNQRYDERMYDNKCHESDDEPSEIDYPDEDECFNDSSDCLAGCDILNDEIESNTVDISEDGGEIITHDADDDYHHHNRHHYHHYHHHHTSSVITTCVVCCDKFRVHPFRLDELDHHITQIGMEYTFVNPCKKHNTCYQCIRNSLLLNTQGTLREGNGHFPCLGDVDCMNALKQKTSTFIYQLREFFNDREWSMIMEQSKMVRLSQSNLNFEHHPYIAPLQPKDSITNEKCLESILELLRSDQVRVKCPICCTVIQKSSACNAIRMCDWEVCWVCGKIDRRLDPSHWNSCPLYEYRWKFPEYMCKEDVCFNEKHSCTQMHHQPGINKVNQVRKSYQLYHLFVSLPITNQRYVIKSLKKIQNEYEMFKKLMDLYQSTKNQH